MMSAESTFNGIDLDPNRPPPTRRRSTSGRMQLSHMRPRNKLHGRKIMSAKQPRDNQQLASCDEQKRNQKLIFAPAEGQYLAGNLDRENLDNDPFLQFHEWFKQAVNTPGLTMPEATTLSTAELPSGRVSARVVYLKELDKRGFVVYSNWGTSRKSRDINSNPHASLTFWWKELERQVRVEGITERVSVEESQTYFDTRIRGSRIGAWASRQSTVLNGREELDERVAEVEKRFEGQEKIPVPEFWGGMRIIPTYIEFWQGRDSRLHDRFTFTRESVHDTTWKIDRLSP